MILEKIKSKGLAHLSYFLSSGSAAAVVDPRRDVEVYERLARRDGARITHIFETHRNEDLISGLLSRPRTRVAGLLYDSLQKLLGLGDGVIIYPAHSAGSVCGSGMASREFSTLGHERRNNPRLALRDRQAFIDFKVAEHHYQPPYFRRMERLNLEGGSAIDVSLAPVPLDFTALPDFAEARLLDVRSIHAFAGGHLPGSLSIPAGMLSSFAGWLLDPDETLILVSSGASQAKSARRHLARIGFDKVVGFIDGPMGAAASGNPVGRLPTVDASTVAERLEQDEDWELLDVRAIDEYEGGHIEGARHIYIGELPASLDSLDRRKAYTTLCGSGARATVAASVLLANGFERSDVFIGSMKAWMAGKRPTVE